MDEVPIPSWSVVTSLALDSETKLLTCFCALGKAFRIGQGLAIHFALCSRMFLEFRVDYLSDRSVPDNCITYMIDLNIL